MSRKRSSRWWWGGIGILGLGAVFLLMRMAMAPGVLEEAGDEPAPPRSLAYGYEEWAYFLVGDRAHRLTGATLGSDRDEGGTSVVRDSLIPSGRGFDIYELDYDVRESYVYAAFRKENRVRPVLDYTLGQHRYFSFFIRAKAGTYIEVSLRDREGRQSLWTLALPSRVDTLTWTNLKLDIDQLRPGRGREPVTVVETVAFAVVREEPGDTASLRGKLQLALLSFTNVPEPLQALPTISPGDLPRTRAYWRASGPAEATPVPSEPPATTTSRYAGGSPSNLALWIGDETSDWLGLAHGLKAMGIPFQVVSDPSEAIRHPLILVYPSLAALTADERTLISEYVTDGGTVVGMMSQPSSGGETAPRAFPGVRAHSVQDAPRTMTFERAVEREGLFPGEDDERRIPLSDPSTGELLAPIASLSTEEATASVLARFNPGGEVAALRRSVGGTGGHLYVWGVDMGALLLGAQNGRAEGAAEHYVNHYYPANDLFLRFLDDVYRAAAPSTAVRLRTAPGGADVPILLTHDVGESQAFEVAAQFAASERQRGVDATYFIFTKYNVPEHGDDDYLFHTVGGRPTAEWIRSLATGFGHELQSHSVSHARDLDLASHWPLGSGSETFEDYYPIFECETPRPEEDCREAPAVRHCAMAEEGGFRVRRWTPGEQCGLVRTVGGSLMGELRVSRFLVEKVSPRQVSAFRSGYLFWPHDLNEAMAAAGYRYSSNGTCNTHLTHLPFQLNYGKGRAELDLYEFCVGSEDQAAPLSDSDDPGGRLQQATDLIHHLRRYGGIFVQLIHPADTWSSWQENLRFQEALIERIQAVPGLGHFTTVGRFGDFWRARDRVSVGVRTGDEGRVLLELVAPDTLEGLSIDVPPTWQEVVRSDVPVVLDVVRHILIVPGRFQGQGQVEVEVLAPTTN